MLSKKHRLPVSESPTSPNALKLLEHAITLHQNGQIDQAIRWYRKTLSIQPTNTTALTNMGTALKAESEFVEAITCYQKALTIQPRSPKVLNSLGIVFNELGKLNESIAYYQKALSIKPDFPEALCNLGNALKSQCKPNEAIACYQKALAITPGSYIIHRNLGNTMKQLGELDEAITCYQKALTIQPDYSEALSDLGNALIDQNKLDEAIICYKKAASIKPGCHLNQYNLGDALRKQGMLIASIDCYEQALSIKPDYYEAHCNVGVALEELGKLDATIASYQRALAIKPDFFDVYHNLNFTLQAMLWEIEQNRSKLDHIIDNITKKAPGSPEPHIIKLQLNFLLGKSIELDDQEIMRNLVTIEQDTIKNDINIMSSVQRVTTEETRNRHMVALFHFGRSGSGYIHSLLDSHPNISTLPGTYLRGFFGRKVWEDITSAGYLETIAQFSRLYDVLFDAHSQNKVPPAFIGEKSEREGISEGFDKMGPNRDQALRLDKAQFISNLEEILRQQHSIDQGRFFEYIHEAYETTLGNDFDRKKLIFYHIHKNDYFSITNFLKYFPQAKLLMIVRNPIQSCESWVQKSLNDPKLHSYQLYRYIVLQISEMLLNQSNIKFRTQNSAGIKLEDIKGAPKKTMQRLCAWLEIEEDPCLYASTMQGLTWWGDPGSVLFGRKHNINSWEDDPIKAKIGTIFSEKDQLILRTLFYPLSEQFGYLQWNQCQLAENVKTVRTLLNQPLDFEKTLARDFMPNHPILEKSSVYRMFHARLKGCWQVLNQDGTYPDILRPLPELAS